MRRRRGTRALLVLLTALAGVVACGGEPTPAAPPAPLRILLVNDDGWAAPGIVALREGLRRAGHRVVEIAPVADGGTSGTAVTMTGELRVRRPTEDPDVVTVSGTAADAVLVGLRAVMGDAWPDLVVSGINTQRSVGVTAMQSGTVGAALTAAGLGFPALAVSTEVGDPAQALPAEFERTADFTVRLVAALQRQRPEGAPLMPQRTVLNVNYPRGPDAARGVVAAPTSDVPTLSLSYRYGDTLESYIPVPTVQPPVGGGNDATALSKGWVTLTDLSADPDRSSPPPRTAARLAPLLTP